MRYTSCSMPAGAANCRTSLYSSRPVAVETVWQCICKLNQQLNRPEKQSDLLLGPLCLKTSGCLQAFLIVDRMLLPGCSWGTGPSSKLPHSSLTRSPRLQSFRTLSARPTSNIRSESDNDSPRPAPFCWPFKLQEGQQENNASSGCAFQILPLHLELRHLPSCRR